MSIIGYFVVYLVVFTISFIGLLKGETGISIIDSFLILLFFLYSYINIVFLRIFDKNKSRIQVLFIILLCLLYLYYVHFLICILGVFSYIYLIYIKKKTNYFDPVKSVLTNFYKNSTKTEILFFIVFYFLTLYIRTKIIPIL